MRGAGDSGTTGRPAVPAQATAPASSPVPAQAQAPEAIPAQARASGAEGVGGLGGSLAYLLTRAERSVNRGLSAALAAEDVTVEQWRILQALADGRGHSMGDLAEAALMPHPTLTKAVDRLVERAVVYRGNDPADRRKVAVFLANRGSELLGRLEAGIAEHHRAIRATYGGVRTERLMRDLELLLRSLDG
ncbi:MarR family winged helix-turn-helix transcriptional regulator [Sphaerisporangium dianthi]|uniref:MarR family winged helix-turn-helix transcriptional regulator n=1 Tax=Sphaerisporangium dianthi TaxID=1436120 RepID=A0ABV9C9E3_9ACTN